MAAVITVLFVTAYRAPRQYLGSRPWSLAGHSGGGDGCLSAHLDRDLYPIIHIGIDVVLASPINTKDAYQVAVTLV